MAARNTAPQTELFDEGARVRVVGVMCVSGKGSLVDVVHRSCFQIGL